MPAALANFETLLLMLCAGYIYVCHETSCVLLDQAQLEMFSCLVQYVRMQVHVHVDVWYG